MDLWHLFISGYCLLILLIMVIEAPKMLFEMLSNAKEAYGLLKENWRSNKSLAWLWSFATICMAFIVLKVVYIATLIALDIPAIYARFIGA